MKKIVFLLIISSLVHSINAQQPANPLAFLNFKPKWSHYSYASSLPDSTQFYWTRRKPLTINDDLYIMLNNSDNWSQGYLIEKLNINTGELLANHQHFDKRKNERTYAFSIKKKGDYIDMLSFKENSRNIKNFIYTFWGRSNYNSYQFCANTLKVCDSTVTNPLDTSNKIINCYQDAAYLYRKGDNILNIESIRNQPTQRAYFTIRELNDKGYMVDSSEISIYFKYNTINHIQMYEYDENKYISFIYATDNTDFTKLEVKMVYFDSNFAIEKVIDISHHLKNTTLLYLHYEDAENFVIGSYQDSLVDNYTKRTYAFYVFNHNGEKIDEVSFKNANLGRYEYMFATLLKPSKKILAVVRRLTNDNKVKIEFMLSNNKGSADVTKTIYPNKHIRNFYPYSMPNNQVLCYFRDIDSTDTKYKKPPSWLYWNMFTPEDLNFPVSLQEPTLQSFSFYPNPANWQINIQADLEYDAINVYSIEGKLVQHIENQDNTLDVSDLPAGLYFFELRQRGKAITKFSKFIKVE